MLGESAASSRVLLHTEITHTVNVLEEHAQGAAQKLFGGERHVTKYVIKVLLGVAGSRPRLEWQVLCAHSCVRVCGPLCVCVCVLWAPCEADVCVRCVLHE